MQTLTCTALESARDRTRVRVAGLVITRQRPGTASGVIFLTLEDETGIANVIVWPKTFEKFRKVVLASRMVLVAGQLQREGIVTHLIADRIIDLSDDLDSLADGASGSRSPEHMETKQRSRRVPAPNPRRHPRDNHIRIISRDFH